MCCQLTAFVRNKLIPLKYKNEMQNNAHRITTSFNLFYQSFFSTLYLILSPDTESHRIFLIFVKERLIKH